MIDTLNSHSNGLPVNLNEPNNPEDVLGTLDQPGASNEVLDSADLSKKLAESIKKTEEAPVCGWKLFTNSLEVVVPIRTYSEANCTLPWRKKYKRHRSQKKIIFFSFLQCKKFIKLPCKINYIRYAPKMLDAHDNLPMSMKYLNDALCAQITGDFRPGRADDSKEIKISYDQVKCKEYAVKIVIEF